MFGGLFGNKKKSAIETRLPALSSGVAASIVNIAGPHGIPAMPGSASRAFQLSTDPNAEARDFVELVESDESMAGRIIRVANSVYFERGKKSSSIEEAVLVIGVEELRSLLNATSLSDMFPSRHPLRAQCWANDIANAIIAKALAAKLLPQKKEEAFLGGLMHDIGKLLLIQRAPEMYSKVQKIVEERGIPFFEAEAEIFVFDHTEVGQLIAERWKFSADLTEVVRCHHQPFASPLTKSPIGLPTIVKSADIIAHALALGHPKGMHRFKNSCEAQLPEVWRALQVEPAQEQQTLSDFKKVYNEELDLYSGPVHP